MPERILTWLRANRALALTVLGALLASGTLAIVVDTDGPNGPTPPVTITLNAAHGDGAPATTETVPARVVARTRTALDGHLGLRDETPPGVPAEQLERVERAVDEQAAQDQLLEGGASATQRGCRTRFVSNQSSRNGVKPKGVVLHYTVGPNLLGELDLNGLDALANRPSSGVSWSYAIDRAGLCHYNVPEDRKPWTQAAANPFYIGIEVVNTGREGTYMDEAGYRKLALVIHDASRRWGFPVAKGAVSNCVPTRLGIIDHSMLGLCGGGHVDINPYPLDDVIAKLQRYARELDAPKTHLTVRDQRIVRGVTAKAPVRSTGHSRRFWCDRAQTQRLAIRKAARATSRGWDRRHRVERFQGISKPYARTCR